MVSLLAITLSTGILVDDAIVEIENIVRHIRMGKSPVSGCARGRRRDRPCGHRHQPGDRCGVHPRELHAVGSRPVLQTIRHNSLGPGAVFAALRADDYADARGLFSPAASARREERWTHPAPLHSARHLGGTISLHHRRARLAFLRCGLSRGTLLPSGLSACHRHCPLDAWHRTAARLAARRYRGGDRYHRQSRAEAAGGGERLRRRRPNSARRRRGRQAPR